MQNTSVEFKNNIYTSPRETTAKVEFGITDSTAQQNSTPTVNSEESSMSLYTQVVSELSQNKKYATFEPDFFKLDGSFVIPPKNDEVGNTVGWLSDGLFSSDGGFGTRYGFLGTGITYGSGSYGGGTYPVGASRYGLATYSSAYPTLTINISTNVSTLGLTIKFDILANEYATDFDIKIYNDSTLLYEYNVTGNTSPLFVWENPLNNYNKVVIEIKKLNNAYRRARIVGVLFGVVKTYTDSNLANMTILEELDLSNKYLPSNEFNLSLINVNQEFNMINPDGIYQYLERKQKLEPYIGLVYSDESIEWIKMGVYYLNDWKSRNGTVFADFTANDIIDVMGEGYYKYSTFSFTNLYDLLEDILIDAGVPNYVIDSSLSTSITSGCLGIVTHRDALQQVAIAAKCIIYQDRYGFLRIVPYAQSSTNDTLTLAEMKEYPDVQLTKLYNVIDVNYKSYTSDITSTIGEITSVFNGTQDLWIEFDKKPAIVSAVSISTGSINSSTHYANGSLLNITATGTATITLTGNQQLISNLVYTLDNSQSGEQKYIVTVDNPLITNITDATAIANWLYGNYQKRLKYDIDFKQNPALEIKDIVSIQNQFSTYSTATIVKNTFNYNGFLSGNITAIG